MLKNLNADQLYSNPFVIARNTSIPYPVSELIKDPFGLYRIQPLLPLHLKKFLIENTVTHS